MHGLTVRWSLEDVPQLESPKETHRAISEFFA